MPFQIVHNDITKMNTDAIVNAANTKLLQGGGVCGAIFQAAGAAELKKECDAIGSCAVGHAVITKGYRLPSRYIIHSVGPIWQGGQQGEAELLAMAYRHSLELAKQYQLESIAFPLISSGIYGYPKEAALQIAISVVSEFLMYHEMDIYLVVFDRKSITLSEKLFSEIDHYIDSYYEDSDQFRTRNRNSLSESIFVPGDLPGESLSEVSEQLPEEEIQLSYHNCMSVSSPRSLEDVVNQMEETFSEMVLRLITEKGKSDVEVYKKANIDRKLFSKIRSNKEYHPKKCTAFAISISLELSLDETKDLLMKAGYTFSMCSKFDIIIRYFIENQNYNMFLINEALFAYDQPLLG
jgi:O-acetyl-ADP-ribose deacetylase (regulator of RNase III)